MNDRAYIEELQELARLSRQRMWWSQYHAVMREQLDRLLEVADRKHVAVVIVPFSAGAHAGLTGPFALLEYADP